MNFIGKCVISVVVMLFSFFIINWLIGKLFWAIADWSLIWFLLLAVVSLFIVRILTKLLSTFTTISMTTMAERWQINTLKQILLWVGWGIATINGVLAFYAADFNTTKVFIVGGVMILSNIWIPWEIHARIQPMEEGADEGKKLADDTMNIALNTFDSIHSGETTYEQAMENLQTIRRSNYINEFQYRMIVGIVNKKLNR